MFSTHPNTNFKFSVTLILLTVNAFNFDWSKSFSVKRVKPFPNKPWFLRICSTSLLKTMLEKEKLLVMSNFSFSHIVFYPFGELSAIFIKFKIVVCKLFWFGSLKFVLWERVKKMHLNLSFVLEQDTSKPQPSWLVVFGFNATLTAKVISWRPVTHMFPGFLTPVLTQLFLLKPPTTFLTCFCRGER